MASLTEQRATALKAAQGIIDGAKGRDLTNTETDTLQEHVEAIKALDVNIEAANHGRDLIKSIGDIGDDETISYKDTGRGRMSLKARAFGASINTAMSGGFKGLVTSGSVATPVPIIPGIQLANRAPLGLLEAFDTIKRDSPAYRFLRETVRTNNAAVVAPGATKPTSVFTVTSVDGRLRVIAHLSEPMDKYMLEDAANLQQFVQAELVDGLQYALETEVLTGDGTGEHFTGIDNTGGIQTVTGAVLLSNLRNAVTQLETVNSTPRFFAVNPVDWATVETTRNTSGNFDFGSPAAAVDRRVWGVPVVASPAVTAGTSYLFSEGAAVISTDGNVNTSWTDGGGLFDKNQLKARTEGRFNLDVLRPAGIVKITTTAA